VGGTGFGPPQGGPPPGAEDCQKGFTPLRADAEAKAKLIQAAGKRKAPPQEACRLIGNFAQAETKMIKFVESHMQKCGIPAQVADQMKKGMPIPPSCSSAYAQRRSNSRRDRQAQVSARRSAPRRCPRPSRSSVAAVPSTH
jgi:hypothetical protein